MRYRRGWNGLTQINPEPVFIPDVMELEVFPVPKKTPIRVKKAHRKRKKNNILKASIGIAFSVMMLAGCTLQRPTITAGVIIAICGTWITLFGIANEGRW